MLLSYYHKRLVDRLCVVALVTVAHCMQQLLKLGGSEFVSQPLPAFHLSLLPPHNIKYILLLFALRILCLTQNYDCVDYDRQERQFYCTHCCHLRGYVVCCQATSQHNLLLSMVCFH